MARAEAFNLSAALLDAHVEAGRGDRVAIRCQGRSVTYAELLAMAARAGAALRELGVERGQRVAMLVADRPEFIATFLGAVRIGAVAVPLNTLLRPHEAIDQVRHCGAVALVAEASLIPELRPMLPKAESVRVVVAVAGTAPDALAYESVTAVAPDELAAAGTSGDDVCFWQYSSGTTGRPKGVVHRHRDYLFNTDAYGRHVVGMTADDRSFSPPKLFFSYGLGNSMAFPLRYGASAVLHPERPDPRTVFGIIRAERPTLFYGVPTLYAQLLALAERDPDVADLSSVRHCVSAGEALPLAIFERWKARFGYEILDGIGSTEMNYICISNVPGRVRPGTSGRAVPGFEAKVADADGREMPAGELGDLWVRGGSVFAGYAGDPERTAQALRDGWVVTGDKYTRDDEGYYRYAGRADDMLKVGGSWVAPMEVEAALSAHPVVLECAVVGRADRDGLVKPAAFVVLRDGARASAEELIAFVADRIAPYKRPRWIDFVPDLPRTATGKVERYKLRKVTDEVLT